MANENETFEQVYAEAMETTGVFPSRQTYAKRYLAAHKRELAEKDAEIEKRRKENEELQQKYLNSQWKIGVMERKINAKDAEIEKLKKSVCPVNAEGNCLNDKFVKAKMDLVERNSLIKELADDLSGYLCESECNGACASLGHCCSQTSRQIIAKAREVIK